MVGLEKAMAMAGMNENILLKIDIEGAEYEILDAIVVNRKSFVACVIESHLIDRNHDDLEKFISAMSDDLDVVHFHAKNFDVNERHSYSSLIDLSLMARDILEPDVSLERKNKRLNYSH